MKILIINHYAGSTKHGMEYRPYYLAREWVKMGHEVMIIAASHSHIRTLQPEMGDQDRLDENIDGIHYRWHRTPPYMGNGLGRVRNIISFLWSLKKDSNTITNIFKPNLVIASSTYPMDIWPAQRIAQLAKAKLIFEVHDLWPLSPMELGGMSKWHPFIQWVQWAEDYAYKHADRVVSLLPKAKDYMVSRGMTPEKFHYIPNGIDPDEFSQSSPLPEDVQTQLSAIKQKGLPIVGYAGTHGLANALDNLLDAAKLGMGQFEVITVGVGPEKERLLKRVEDEQISNVHLLSAIPKKAIPDFLNQIDIAYIGWHENPLYRFGISPNKLMDYMMASKPIIHAVKAGNDPVQEARCGITIPPNDPQALMEAVLKMVSIAPEERHAMGQNGRAFILKNQTYPILAQRFLEGPELSHGSSE